MDHCIKKLPSDLRRLTESNDLENYYKGIKNYLGKLGIPKIYSNAFLHNFKIEILSFNEEVARIARGNTNFLSPDIGIHSVCPLNHGFDEAHKLDLRNVLSKKIEEIGLDVLVMSIPVQ